MLLWKNLSSSARLKCTAFTRFTSQTFSTQRLFHPKKNFLQWATDLIYNMNTSRKKLLTICTSMVNWFKCGSIQKKRLSLWLFMHNWSKWALILSALIFLWKLCKREICSLPAILTLTKFRISCKYKRVPEYCQIQRKSLTVKRLAQTIVDFFHSLLLTQIRSKIKCKKQYRTNKFLPVLLAKFQKSLEKTPILAQKIKARIP